MEWTSIIFILSHILTSANSKTVEIECPGFCDCDIFNTFKRAVCSGRSLVSLELNIPPHAQILDLSENHITEIGDKVLLNLGLTNLKLFNVSHNKIRQIHFNGFQGLEHLISLDLSFNAIEYFTRSWFESLPNLEELYLSGNKLKSINTEPIIDIGSLRVLDISKCGITRLNPETLSSLLSLQTLDISGNYLQYIDVDLIKKLPNLTSLRNQDNNFNCKNRKLIAALKYIKHKKIDNKDPCIINVNSFPSSFAINQMVQKFQKIEMPNEDETSEMPSIVRNSWIFEQDEELANKTTVIEVCSSNITTSSTTTKYDSIVINLVTKSPWTAVILIFSYGVLCGIAFTYAVTICLPKKKPLTIIESDIPDGCTPARQTLPLKKTRRTNSYSGGVLYSSLKTARKNLSREATDDDSDLGETLVMNEFHLANSTPMASRRVV